MSLLAIAVGVLQGCTSLSDKTNVVELQTVTSEEQLAQLMAEWESYKPKIDEFIAAKEANPSPQLIADNVVEEPIEPMVTQTVIPPIAEAQEVETTDDIAESEMVMDDAHMSDGLTMSESMEMEDMGKIAPMETVADEYSESMSMDNMEETSDMTESKPMDMVDEETPESVADVAASKDMEASPQVMPKEKRPPLPQRAEEYVIAEMPPVSNIDEADAMMTSLEYKLDDDVIIDERNVKDDTAITSADEMTVDDPTVTKEEGETVDRYVRAQFKNNAPAASSSSTNAIAAPMVIAKAKPAATTPVRKAKAGEYGLQLVSHTKVGEAEKTWSQVSRKFRTLLSGKEAIVEKAMVKSKQYYRLKVGPYYDKKIAVDTCKQLVLSHQDCILSNYYGEPID